jgi:uroporphyrinogen decarboxylase
MNKRDELMKLLDSSYKPARVPAAFFLHFDPAFHVGRAAVDKHLEFFKFTDMDLVKIQFEHHMPAMRMRKPQDWATVPLYGTEFWQETLAVVKGIVESARKDALVILTLYSPFMFATQIAEPEIVVRHLQENPEAFKRGIEVITQSLLGFVKDCVALGVDGFYASTQGGESGRFAKGDAFKECIRPYDLAVLDEINRACPFNILHVCDYHLPYADLTPFVDYPGQVVNTNLVLEGREMEAKEAAKLFRRPFMGGLERKGVITKGSPQAIREAVQKVLETAPDRFILGADCTVPPDTPWENLRIAIQAAHDFRR